LNSTQRCDAKSEFVAGKCPDKQLFSPNTEIKLAPQHVTISYSQINYFFNKKHKLKFNLIESSIGQQKSRWGHRNSIGATTSRNSNETRSVIRERVNFSMNFLPLFVPSKFTIYANYSVGINPKIPLYCVLSTPFPPNIVIWDWTNCYLGTKFIDMFGHSSLFLWNEE
jgi:hypothetical protein